MTHKSTALILLRSGTLMDSYPVLWCDEGEPMATGKLVLGQDSAELSGASDLERRPISERLPYAEIESIHVGRTPRDRLHCNPALIIERREQKLVRIAVLGVGVLGEVADLLARLAA